jgi:hypothetical protein
VVTWQAHVDDKTSSKRLAYDMIMGMYFMTYIVITVDCEQILLIPQVRPAQKYPNSPWEMIHPPWGDNAVCM